MALDLVARQETAKALTLLQEMIALASKRHGYEAADHERWRTANEELRAIIAELAK